MPRYCGQELPGYLKMGKMGWMLSVDWTGRVVLVTGGSRGIGRAISEYLASPGLAVAVNYHSQDAEARVTQELVRAKGAECEVFSADVSRACEASALIDAVVERWGRLDVLVNNAGITRDALLMRTSDEQWADVLATNLNGVFFCTRAAVRPMMKARFGRVVNISSIAGLAGNAGQANYSAAKAGVIGFSKAVARELASRNITVNVVAPGLVETDITSKMNQSAYDTIVQSIPLRRVGRPAEVAHAVKFLAESDYITGQTLVVDGGLVME